ncbi:Non-reducing end alpha-L-arabinofuranosidase BoGH43A [Paramyrothecium foliicola]|nr:Non-reducing end alpha-L-arabinofuranosidase BoGH43A [Paramyrothecium foliicola]
MERVQCNPIVPGFAPDPSTVYVDGTYFLVNSTFQFFPGLPIYASNDLCTWTHIGNAINRRSQLDLGHSMTKLFQVSSDELFPVQGGLYAPTIRYHKGVFYIVCTNVHHKPDLPEEVAEYTNFILTTRDIWANEWSEPIFLDFFGVDVSLFWDDDDHVYLIGAEAPAPATKIQQYEIDVKTGKQLSEKKLLWEGISKVFPEGPHMYKKDGWYYLLVAEGGCFEGHHTIMARSKNIWGPFEENPANPIMPMTHPSSYVAFTGHGDLIQDPASGQWYFICLGARKTQEERFIMCRETFITTATWPKGECPTIDFAQLDIPIMGGRKTTPAWPTKRNARSFTPDVNLLHIRNPSPEHYKYSEKGITLVASQSDLDQSNEPVSFVGKRQRALVGHATSTLHVGSTGDAKSLKAGLCYYKDEHRYSRIFLDAAGKRVVWEIINKCNGISRRETRSLAEQKSTVLPADLIFGISYTEESLAFWFRLNFDEAEMVEMAAIDTRDMTNREFVGPVIGIFAVGGESTPVEFGRFSVD